MSNAPGNVTRTPGELAQRAAEVPGSDPFAVRVVGGARSYNCGLAPGFAFERTKTGAADEAAPAASYTNARQAINLANFFDLQAFSGAGLYLDFVDANGDSVALDNASVATLTTWRLTDMGQVIKGPTFAAVGHRVELDDPKVYGRPTLYRVTDVTLDGAAAAVVVRCAGDGLGYK
jgi:hypothetical protein